MTQYMRVLRLMQMMLERTSAALVVYKMRTSYRAEQERSIAEDDVASKDAARLSTLQHQSLQIKEDLSNHLKVQLTSTSQQLREAQAVQDNLQVQTTFGCHLEPAVPSHHSCP